MRSGRGSDSAGTADSESESYTDEDEDELPIADLDDLGKYYFRLIYEHTNQMLLVAKRDSATIAGGGLGSAHFVFVNPAVTEWLGYIPSEMYALPNAYACIHPDDAPAVVKMAAVSDEERSPLRLRFISKAGRQMWFDAAVAALPSGEVFMEARNVDSEMEHEKENAEVARRWRPPLARVQPPGPRPSLPRASPSLPTARAG